MIKTITLLLLIVITISTSAQNKIILELEELSKKEDNLILSFALINSGEESIRIYKPNEQDICSSVIRVIFVNESNNKEHLLFPCKEIIDFDSIILNCDNSICLLKNEKFFKEIKFTFKDIAPYLAKNIKYKVLMEFNLDGITFEGDINNLVKCDVKSSNFKIIEI
ncbi:MAG: hypothetical protein GQ564_08390 [Bacteroidales bacterium]|nr:hypothetical protein [Bacteroidales bacterium]